MNNANDCTAVGTNAERLVTMCVNTRVLIDEYDITYGFCHEQHTWIIIKKD